MAMPQCCYLAKGAKRPSHTTNTIKFDRIPFDPCNSIKSSTSVVSTRKIRPINSHPSSLCWISELFTHFCKMGCCSHDDQRAGSFLKQRISMALQIGNAACVLGTVSDRGTRRVGENMAADVSATKLSSKRLLTGWEENCRRNVSS